MTTIPLAALKKLEELREDNETYEKFSASEKSTQIGSTIPRHYFASESFTLNPSAISAGLILKLVETDETIMSAVEFKILMLVSKIGDYDHSNPEIKDMVQNFLKNLRYPAWIETLESFASSYITGFSVSEIVCGLNEKMQKVPVRVPTYHPSTIAFETDRNGLITENGILQFIEMNSYEYGNPNERFATVSRYSRIRNPFVTPDDRPMPTPLPGLNGYGMVRIPRDKVVHITNKAYLSFGSPYGKTSVRAVHLAWQMKCFFIKQMGITSKKNGTPTIVGQAPHAGVEVEITYPDGRKENLSPQEALRKMLEDRESNDSIVIGAEEEGYKINVVQNTATLDGLIAAVNLMNVLIFRGFLMPSLIMTDGSSGSRSLGDKHFDIVNRIADVDAKKFKGAIIRDLIEPTIKENFGEQEDYGSFLERPASIEEQEKMSTIVSQMTTDGFLSASSEADREWVRSNLGAPKDDFNLFGDDDPEEPIDRGTGEDDDLE